MDTVKTRQCSVCGEEKPLTPEFFPSDRSHNPPFRRDCKACRNSTRYNETKKQEILDKRLTTARQAVLLESIRTISRNVASAPHTAELLERMYAAFGGLDGYVKEWYAHYLMTDAGGPQRTKMLQDVIRLTVNNVALGGAKKPLDYYTEEELEKELTERVESMALRLIGREEEICPVEVLDSADHVEVRETG